MEAVLLKFLAAGGDITTMVIGYILFKYHTRLTKIETQLAVHLQKPVANDDKT